MKTNSEKRREGANARDLMTRLMPHLQNIRDKIMAQWASSDTVDKREACHARLRALQEIVSEIDSVVSDGMIAERELEKGGKHE